VYEGQIVDPVERRPEAMDGKGSVVCMSRRICVELHRELGRLQPQWLSSDDAAGEIKVVMTGSASDPVEWQQHIRNKPRREALANRFRDPSDRLKIVLVRDMWLTGFDVPPLHTMYIDKPMRGHSLMQAIARVNRVFRDKPGGLVVDYIGLGEWLKRALRDYTASRGRGAPAIDIRAALAALREKPDVFRGILRGFDYSGFASAHASQRLKALTGALDRIEGADKVTGQAEFAYEYEQQNAAYAIGVQSTIARGRITGVDEAGTLALPGVPTVIWHRNTPKPEDIDDGQLELFQTDRGA